MDKIQKFMETKLPLYLWGGLGCMCLAGAVFTGAWWHLGTAAVCALMFLAFKSELYREAHEGQKEKTER